MFPGWVFKLDVSRMFRLRAVLAGHIYDAITVVEKGSYEFFLLDSQY